MEDFQGQITTDTNIDYDILNNAINTYEQTLGESNLPSTNLIIEKSMIKFFDLILIDKQSNFCDLKIKLEISPNKKDKAQYSMEENIILFTNFSEVTNNVLERLNKDPSIFSINYFNNNFEKINTEFEIDNYDGDTIYLYLLDRSIEIHDNDLIFDLHTKLNNYSNNINGYDNSVCKKRNLTPDNSKESKFSDAFENINYLSASKTSLNFYNHKSQKKDSSKLKDLIEENLNFNLALNNDLKNKGYKKVKVKISEVINSKNINANFLGQTLFKKEPLYFARKLKFDKNNANKEKAYIDPLHNLIEKDKENDINNFIQYKNKFKKAKLLKNEILFKNKKTIEEQNKDSINLASKRNLSLIPPSKSIVYSNIKRKTQDYNDKRDKNNIFENNNIFTIEKTLNTNNYENTYNLDKNSSNNLTKISFEKNFKTKNSFKINFNQKKIENIESSNICNSERKGKISLIESYRKTFTHIKPKKVKSIINKDQINQEESASYLLTNQSYSDRIKPINQENQKKTIENKTNLTSDNFYQKARESRTTEKKPNFIKSNILNEKFATYKKVRQTNHSSVKAYALEEEFLNRKISHTRNSTTNKFSNIVLSNSTINEEFTSRKTNLNNKNFDDNINFKKLNFEKQINPLNNLSKNFKNNKSEISLSLDKKAFDVTGNKTFNKFINVENNMKFHSQINSPINNSLIKKHTMNNPIPLNNANIKIKNNHIIDEHFAEFSDKNITSNNQNFLNNLKDNKSNFNLHLNDNKIDKCSKKASSMNSTNFDSLMASLTVNKSDKNIQSSISKINLFEKEKLNMSPNKNLNPSLKLKEKFTDLDKSFTKYFENNYYNENSLNTNSNNNNKKRINHIKTSENNRLFNNPTLNNKINTTNLNQDSEFENCYDPSSYTKNKRVNLDQIRYNLIGKKNQIKPIDIKSHVKANSFRSKFIPNINKKTLNEINYTKILIKNFITTNLSFIITNEFIEENLQWLILNDCFKPKKIDFDSLKAKKPKNRKSIIEENNNTKLNFLSELKLKSTIIDNYNENLISVETNPAQENFVISEKDYQLAREFIFYNYINCKSLEKYFFKKLNKNDIVISDSNSNNPISKSLNFIYNKTNLYNQNLNYSNLNSTAANETSWFNSMNHNLALEFFSSANNSKEISEFNLFVEEIFNKLKKDISGLLNFMNFIKLNKMNLHIKNFALDLIFVNLYIVNPNDKEIDEELIYLLIEFISNSKEKKLFFENYKKLCMLTDKAEFEKNNKDFYNSKYLFFKNFLKMLLKISDNNIDLIKKSFKLNDQEIYFILISDFNELKSYIDDKEFKEKITSIFELLINSLS